MVYIGLAILLIVIIWLISGYNTFVRLSNKTKEAFSTMDVYLKKRWDLLPNLVETVKGYAKHESATFESVVKARDVAYESMSVSDKIAANENISRSLPSIFALAENYPELKANQNFLELQRELSQIEDDILNARKYYNAVVNKFNTQIEMFPGNLIAGMFNFKQAKLYEAAAEERNRVDVSFA